MAEQVEIFTIPNGLRGVARFCDSPVEYCGIALNVGSRDEDPHLPGLAHFVEHTIFKGTEKRRSAHIINRMEAVGGELNAYTTKEETVVYSIFPAGHLERAVELISDLVLNSRFPLREIDREREVVCDEIDSCLDVPSEAVFDEFEELAFAGSPLAHNILGSRKGVEDITPDDCRDYLRRFYTVARAAFFYMGPQNPARVERIVGKYLSAMPVGTSPADRTAPPLVTPFTVMHGNDSHQTHTVMGARIPDMYSPGRHVMAMMANILGGPGMNSRLNVALREKRGLVYSVEASPMTLTDCGLLTVYFGCDPSDNRKCRTLVSQEIERMASAPLSQKALDAARRQYLGQLTVASENREQLAINTGRSLLYRGRIAGWKEIEGRFMDVTSEQIRMAAESVAPAFSVLSLGPVAD